MHRNLSVRSRKNGESSAPAGKHRFTMSSLRGTQQPDLSKKLFKLIKTENHAISAYETAGRERVAIASQLSDWGESTGDDALSEVSDKLGVLLAEIAEQEDMFAQGLEEYRGVLKQIRNTESSVQPSRDHKAKISDELAKLKYKEPTSTKILTLEQELVRAEAQSLVAEAQLTNVTRQKFREAYQVHLAAFLERSEKQALLAKQAQRLLLLLDDTPVVPGEEHRPFEGNEAARVILNDAEAELKEWTPSWEMVPQEHQGIIEDHRNVVEGKHYEGEDSTVGSHFADAGASSVGGEHVGGQHVGGQQSGAVYSAEDREREQQLEQERERQPVAA
ncbi:hypothetical protein EJ08DRAFT_603374 [Tothia fuscella]|uniref:Eisosome component PIL1-domain-containing protein n=1 Tax=Tothia fuscella TaxID=1048955 RepID=A0A9P4U2Y6_9PEZI|nr:hypothetical protein EJ08DRAFT_603374 [Tothia fuscella]